MKLHKSLQIIGVSTLVASGITLGLRSPSEAAVLVVDNYQDGGVPNGICDVLNYDQCTYFNSGTPRLSDTQTGFSESDVIGGSRQLTLAGSNLNGTTPAVARNSVNFGVNFDPGGFLLIGNQGGRNSIGTATYDANGAGLNLGAGNVRNFDLSIYDFFEFIFTSQDQPARLTLTFTSNLSGTPVVQSVFQNLPVFATGETQRSVKFALDDFNNINFGDIDRIAFSITGTANDLDAQFELVQFGQDIQEIPEPSTLLGLGGLGLSLFGRKGVKKLKHWLGKQK